MSAAGGERLVELSLVDQQFLLALGGQTLLACSYERPDPRSFPRRVLWRSACRG